MFGETVIIANCIVWATDALVQEPLVVVVNHIAGKLNASPAKGDFLHLLLYGLKVTQRSRCSFCCTGNKID